VDADAEPAYGRPDHEQQVWATADLRLGWGWSVFGGIRYDLEFNKTVRDLIGVGYDCDCFSAKLYYKHDNTSDRDVEESHAIMLQVDFRTLGQTTVGSKL
jgi:LPS-assembly protein